MKKQTKKKEPVRSLVDILAAINNEATDLMFRSESWRDTEYGVENLNAADRIDQFIYEARVLLGLAK